MNLFYFHLQGISYFVHFIFNYFLFLLAYSLLMFFHFFVVVDFIISSIHIELFMFNLYGETPLKFLVFCWFFIVTVLFYFCVHSDSRAPIDCNFMLLFTLITFTSVKLLFFLQLIRLNFLVFLNKFLTVFGYSLLF